ncbi:trypsin-like serine protease [Myceligenerans pegani]|uniref:Trypsin-like serine protease n=1 Tax=Myceligenerans pegani TaxID=2776917 RepID=A0ABR9N3S7_9MICO|nr:trypsin-like serine protease [Myceligenerans sp. TRM 65318]MBE1878309.1 trypsin-like serine protease [Myceligenerans sp. TRM 65318]MBE3020580.1 trypsin-like serine protease [Myceligenerans sp. TRM 65318]
MTGIGRATRAAIAAAAGVALVAPVLAAPASAVVGTTDGHASYAFTARLDIGDGRRACSGALVADRWILTAASCFADDPSAGLDVPAGRPELSTVATVGRVDLTGTAGQERQVIELVPHESRDLVMARLDLAVPGVDPVAIASSAPTTADALRLAGFGRTATEWAPLALHTAPFGVDAVADGDVTITGSGGASACAGDTGGPLLRDTAGGPELVAVVSRSWRAGCWGADPAETRNTAIGVRADDVSGWITTTIGKPRIVDFDCDGVRDIAIADPEATVDGAARGGAVRIVYGGSGETALISQASPGVTGGSEPNDRFGYSIATFDGNQDGCTDLVVSTPYESVDGARETGWVEIVHGARDGLTHGPADITHRQGYGEGSLGASAPEDGDLLGYSLAAGHTSDGTPWLVMGVPGEDLSSVADGGMIFYCLGSAPPRAVHQDKDGVLGVGEAGDRFGETVTGDGRFFVAGTPHEAVGSDDASGIVHLFRHELRSDGLPVPITQIHQDTGGVSGVSEPGDEFGGALDMTEYRPSGAASPVDSLLAIGSPGEAITYNSTGRDDAGRAVVLHLRSSGGWTQVGGINQATEGVSSSPESFDHFGASVAIASTDPADASGDTMVLTVGAPDEDLNGHDDAGDVHVFPGLDSFQGPVTDEFQLVPGQGGLPGSDGAGQRLGQALTATDEHLYVGMPDGPSASGAVHAIPWSNVTGGTAGAVTTFQPGAGGIPAGGVAFGSSIQ